MGTVSIIGCGSVGRAMGVGLREAGYVIAALADRRKASARAARALIGQGTVAGGAAAARAARIVFITTGDSAIESVCAATARAGGFRAGQIVLHCSGALTADALDSARRRGAAVGSLHPLQSFARSNDASLRGVWFSFQGDAAAKRTAREITKRLGGHFIEISAEAKPLYHAAAVIASNYLVALTDAASSLLSASGAPVGRSVEALLPLILGTIGNLRAVGLPQALTGPIARGDAAIVAGHVEALRVRAPELLELYCVMGLRTLSVARKKGRLTASQCRRIERILSVA